MKFQGKKILVLGAGVSGISVALTLVQAGAEVMLNDSQPEEKIKRDLSEVREAGVVLALGRQDEALLEGIDGVVLSPGISIYSPLVKAAETKGITVMSEIEVAYRLCKASVIGITGTNGKTTTTTLTGEMLKTTGREVLVGGNIGTALSSQVSSISEDGLVLAEISSFQLEGIIKFRPYIAAILNLTPDHLDRHSTMDIYREMKERIFVNQTQDDYLVLNYDDPQVRGMANRTVSQVMFFSRATELSEGVFVKDGMIKISWRDTEQDVCPVTALQLRGAHNVENALAACGVAFFAGVKAEDMAQVLCGFTGVEHRIELVAAINGVTYYNDSKATNPESSIKALEAFPGGIILIAGGRDKNTDLTEFMQLIRERVDELILLGEAKDRFGLAALKHGVQNIHKVGTMADAVKLAHSLARSPQVVLLSPACASYDMFNNYEERGRVFKDLVHALS